MREGDLALGGEREGPLGEVKAGSRAREGDLEQGGCLGGAGTTGSPIHRSSLWVVQWSWVRAGGGTGGGEAIAREEGGHGADPREGDDPREGHA